MNADFTEKHRTNYNKNVKKEELQEELHVIYDQKSGKGESAGEFMRFMKQRDNLCGRTEIMHSGEQGTDRKNCWKMIFLREICMYWKMRSQMEAIIHAVFAFIEGEDPVYLKIEQGSWMVDTEYAAVHRVASDGTVRNVLEKIMDYCKAQIPHLRIDTHEDNKVMQHVLEKYGFVRCGIVYVPDGSRVLHMSYWKNPNEFLMQNSYKYTFCYYVNLW